VGCTLRDVPYICINAYNFRDIVCKENTAQGVNCFLNGVNLYAWKNGAAYIIDNTINGKKFNGAAPYAAIEIKDNSLFTCWIGSDFLGEGRNAVRWMDEHLKEPELRIVHLQGNLGSSAQLGRTAGLNEGLSTHENWQLVYRESGDFTQAKGQELVEAILADGLSFNVIFSENDNMAYGAIDALKNAGLTPGEDVSIISFDASRHALELVMQGQISYDVECNPLHGPRVESIIRKLESGLTPPKLTYVEETAFDAASISQPLLDSRGY
jgi:simple sugar transport system substrate-binding protein